MAEFSNEQRADHLRLAAMAIRSHIGNPKVSAMHEKAGDGYLEKMTARHRCFDELAQLIEQKAARDAKEA